MECVPIESSLASAWWFAILSNLLFLMVSASPFLGLALVASLGIGRGSFFGETAVSILAFMLAATLFGLLIWGLIVHVILVVTGGTNASIRRTYQALCYSTGANAPISIPCAGLYFGWIWWLVSAVLTVKSAQRVHGGRAAFAVLSPPLVGLAALAGVYIWFLFWVALPMQGRAVATLQTSNAGQFVAALKTYHATNNDTWPEHAVQLLQVPSTTLSSWSFSTPSPTTVSNLNKIKIGEETLGNFEMLSPERQDKAVQAAIESLPDGTIAHRLGDWVFTYHGIPDPDAESAALLWVAVAAPEQNANRTVSPTDTIVVAQLDGTTTSFSYSRMSTMLASQNAFRAQHGLPPLPDPCTVTHDQPAVAPSVPTDQPNR
jgi:hypothetical protein